MNGAALVKQDFSRLYKQHRTTQHESLKKTLAHIEHDGQVLHSVRNFLEKRASVEAEYAKNLERLAKQYRIPLSQGGMLPPNHPIAASGLQSSFHLMHGAVGMNQMASSIDELKLDSSIRPTDLATLILVNETERQSKTRWNLAIRISQSVSNIISDWEKQYAMRLSKANEYGYVLVSEFSKIYEDVPKAKQIYDHVVCELASVKARYNDYVRKHGKDESKRFEKLTAKLVCATHQAQYARNDYLLALEAANACINVFYADDLPKFFELTCGTFLDDLRKVFAEFDAAALECYRQGLDSVQSLSSAVENITSASEYEWFVRVKEGIPPRPSFFAFQSTATDDVFTITCDEVTGLNFAKMLQVFLQKREKVAASIAKLEKDIMGIDQMVHAYTRKPEYGDPSEPMNQAVDFKFRLFILRNYLVQADAQIKLLTEAGIHSLLPALSTGPNLLRIAKPYNNYHKVDLSVVAGDMVKQIDDDVLNGWMKVQKVNGEEGYIPVLVVEGADPSTVLGVTSIYAYDATCPGELTFATGEEIRVTDTDIGSDAWWEGELHGNVGQFPRAFVTPTLNKPIVDSATIVHAGSMPGTVEWEEPGADLNQKDTSESPSTPASPSSPSPSPSGVNVPPPPPAPPGPSITAQASKPSSVRALYDYTAQSVHELSFKKGQVITVLNDALDTDWCLGSLDGKKGEFPRTYVEKVSS